MNLFLKVDISWYFDLSNLFTKNWDIYSFLYYLNFRFNDWFINNFLNNFLDFYNFFYDSWDWNNFLYDFLNFYNFRHLNQFLNNFFYDSWYRNRFFHNCFKRYDFIFIYIDNFWHFNDMIYYLLYFNASLFIQNNWFLNLNLLIYH